MAYHHGELPPNLAAGHALGGGVAGGVEHPRVCIDSNHVTASFSQCQGDGAWSAAGSPPRRRTVLSVFPWAVEAVGQYLESVRPLLAEPKDATMWPTERGSRLSARMLNHRLTGRYPYQGCPGRKTDSALDEAATLVAAALTGVDIIAARQPLTAVTAAGRVRHHATRYRCMADHLRHYPDALTSGPRPHR
jgi:hypothetical protein